MSDDSDAEEDKHTTFAVRLCTFIRARYLERGIVGEFQVGRTLGASTKALLVVVSANEGTPEDIADAQVGPAAAALVRSTITSMLRSALSLPVWCDVVREIGVSLTPLGFNIGVGVNVHLRATASSLAAAEVRRLAALPTAPDGSFSIPAEAAETSVPPPTPSAAWKPGHFIKKAMGGGDNSR